MPRSGTSLIEQVLSAHDDVAGAGELTFLTDAIYKEFFLILINLILPILQRKN